MMYDVWCMIELTGAATYSAAGGSIPSDCRSDYAPYCGYSDRGSRCGCYYCCSCQVNETTGTGGHSWLWAIMGDYGRLRAGRFKLRSLKCGQTKSSPKDNNRKDVIISIATSSNPTFWRQVRTISYLLAVVTAATTTVLVLLLLLQPERREAEQVGARTI